MNPDRIEKNIILRAPRARVWRALADAQAFGEWFGMKLSGSFAPGASLQGQPTHKGIMESFGRASCAHIWETTKFVNGSSGRLRAQLPCPIADIDILYCRNEFWF